MARANSSTSMALARKGGEGSEGRKEGRRRKEGREGVRRGESGPLKMFLDDLV